MTVNTICYECNIPCERAGKKLSSSTREWYECSYGNFQEMLKNQ